MAQGLALLLTTVPECPALRAERESAPSLQRDSQFVRALANIVLRTHSELTHVY
jgi:hypothetical protein